jgi:small redox-active disulfide protein 2
MLIRIYSTEICSRCRKLYELVQKIIAEKGISAEVEHITDPQAIADAGIISSPTLVVDEKIVSTGWVPSRREIERWLEEKKGVDEDG